MQCVLRHRKVVVEREKKAAQLFRVSSSVFHSPIRWSLLLHPPLSRSLARSFHHILYFTAYTQCVYVYCLLTHGLIIPFSLSRFLSSARRQNGFQQCRCKVAFASVFFYIPFSLSLSVTGRENLFPKTSSTRQPGNRPTNPLYDEKEYKGVQKVVNNRLLKKKREKTPKGEKIIFPFGLCLTHSLCVFIRSRFLPIFP